MKIALWLMALGVTLVTSGLYYLVSEQAAIMFLLSISLMGNVIGYWYMAKNAPLLARDRRFNRFTIEWPNSWFSKRR